jgi:cell division protein FtsQ
MNWNQANKPPVNMGQRKKVSPEGEKRPKYGDGMKFGNISMSLKTMPWGVILGSIAIVALLAGGLLLGQHYQSNVTVSEVVVTGNHYTNEVQILQQASVPAGIAADSLRLLSVIEKVETLPYVQQASARITHNGRLHIQITERQPIGLFIHGNARRYADKNGVLLPLVSGLAADVPLVYGVSWSARQDTLRSEAFFKIRDFLIAVYNDPVAFATISEIAWSQDEGIVALSNENGIRLVFGNERYSEAIQNWSLFYRQVVAVRGPGSFNTIDLRYEGQVVTRETTG